jgi:cyclin T
MQFSFEITEVSNQMLELYEQNRVAPPSQSEAAANEEAEGSSASGAHPHQPRTPVKAPSSEGGDPASASHHHHPSSNGHPTPPTLQHHSLNGPRHSKPDEQQQQEESNHAGPTTDSAPSRVASSPMASDAMKKILNTDKVKALVEKRRKLKPDNSRKLDMLDDDDLLIERELEHGVELAISNKKGHSSQVENTKNGYYGDDKGEEGELSIDSQELLHSPETVARKKRPASPGGTGKGYGNSFNDVRLNRLKYESHV